MTHKVTYLVKFSNGNEVSPHRRIVLKHTSPQEISAECSKWQNCWR